jgi:hypothetical protein
MTLSRNFLRGPASLLALVTTLVFSEVQATGPDQNEQVDLYAATSIYEKDLYAACRTYKNVMENRATGLDRATEAENFYICPAYITGFRDVSDRGLSGKFIKYEGQGLTWCEPVGEMSPRGIVRNFLSVVSAYLDYVDKEKKEYPNVDTRVGGGYRLLNALHDRFPCPN